MRLGKLSAAVHDRCVGNVMRHMPSADGEKGTCPSCSGGFAVRPVEGRLDPSPEMTVVEAIYRLWAGKVLPETAWKQTGIFAGFLLTPDTTEQKLREWTKRIMDFCSKNGISFQGADAWVSDAVQRDILTVHAAWKDMHPGSGVPGDAAAAPGAGIYMAGFAGMAGTGIIAQAKEEMLLQRFPSVLVEECLQFTSQTGFPVISSGMLWPVLDGGVLGALWELGEYLKTGMEVDLRAVPVRQETIEVCEYLGLHPYQLYSCGAVIAVVPQEAETHSAEWNPEGTGFWQRIGRITEGRGRILCSGEDRRFLDKPAQDALAVLLEKEF